MKDMLTNAQKDLLHRLSEAATSEQGVDELDFRLPFLEKGEKDIEERVNELIKMQAVHRDRSAKTYRVTIFGLAVQDTAWSEELFGQIDQIHSLLRKHFLSTRSAREISFREISGDLGINLDRVSLLVHMLWDLHNLVALNYSHNDPESGSVYPQEGLLIIDDVRSEALKILADHLGALKGGELTVEEKPAKTRYTSDREKVLGAAVAVLAAFPEQCKNGKGKVVGSKIAALLADKAPALFGDYEPPMVPEVMAKHINAWLSVLR